MHLPARVTTRAAALLLAALAVLAVLAATATLSACGRSVSGGSFRTPNSSGDTALAGAPTTSSAPVAGAAAYTHPDATSAGLQGLEAAFVAAGNLDYRHIDRDLTRARAAYAPSLQGAFDQVRAATAAQYRSQHTVQTATAKSVAVIAMPSSTSMTALIVGYVATTSDDTDGQPFVNAANVIVGGRKVDGHWVIATESTLQVATAPHPSAGASGRFDAGSTGLAAAMSAARAQLTRSLNVTRKNFATQRQAILAGTGGGLTQLVDQSLDTQYRQLTTGRYDTAGRVIAAGVNSVAPGTVSILMCTTQDKITATSRKPTLGVQRLLVTMTLASGNRWLATGLSSVG